jgi:hypothetical protein
MSHPLKTAMARPTATTTMGGWGTDYTEEKTQLNGVAMSLKGCREDFLHAEEGSRTKLFGGSLQTTPCSTEGVEGENRHPPCRDEGLRSARSG